MGYYFQELINKYDARFDLKVLYVGQAFGENGERVAPDRITSHKTLQKVYKDAIINKPDEDIWLMLWTFNPQLVSFAHSSLPVNKKSIKNSEKHEKLIKNNPITLDQQINFVEAALIKYFQPLYNHKFKDHFPERYHTSYNQCFDLDVNAVSFEIDTETLKTRIYSDTIAPSLFHVGKFPLNSKKKRRSLFDHFKPQ